MHKIDSLIKVKEFDNAEKLITNTKSIFSFRKNSDEKLALEFRSIQILYEKGKKEQALEQFLVGFEKLKSKSSSPCLY